MLSCCDRFKSQKNIQIIKFINSNFILIVVFWIWIVIPWSMHILGTQAFFIEHIKYLNGSQLAKMKKSIPHMPLP